jgi:hypothetical protein
LVGTAEGKSLPGSCIKKSEADIREIDCEDVNWQGYDFVNMVVNFLVA